MRVLIVEDDQLLREQLAATLRANDYVVDVAVDGEEGLYFAQEYPIDLAIVDLGLPKIDGVDLIKALRKSGSSCPILILTARSRWQEKVEGLEAGADDYHQTFSTRRTISKAKSIVATISGFSR